MLEQNVLSKLINKYIKAAIKHGKGTESGDSILANKQHDILTKIYKEIISMGEEGREALTNLFEHEDPYVRLWSATHSLNYVTNKAKKILKKLKGELGFVGLDAEMTLAEWKKGNLKID